MKKTLLVIVATMLFMLVAGCQSGGIVPTRISENELMPHFKNACNKAAKAFFVLPENDVYLLAAAGVCVDNLSWYYQNNSMGRVWPGPNQLPGGASAAGAIALQIAQSWDKAGWIKNQNVAVECLMGAFAEERQVLEKEFVITPSP